MTKSKFLLISILFFVTLSSFGIDKGNSQEPSLNAAVEFHHGNALTEKFPVQSLEILVSNPPYIAASEKKSMNKTVLEYEPHLALFVEDKDPLVFYKMIAQKGFESLTLNGKVFVEINERFGEEVSELFLNAGFKKVQIIKDLQGKNRIVTALKR